MRKLIMLLFILVSLQLPAQEVTKVVVKEGEQLLVSKMSFDGKYLAISSMDYNKIFMYDVISDKLVTEITGAGIGWGMNWSSTDNLIAVRENIFEKGDRTSKIRIFNSKGEDFISSEVFPDVSLPYWSIDGKVCTFKPNKLEAKSFTTSKTFVDDGLFIDGTTLIVQFSSQRLPETLRSWMTTGRAIGFSYSPDGKKIAVEYVSAGIRVYDLEFGVIYDFGEGEAPVWADNENLVYMVVKDDGHDIQDGNLYLRKYDGSYPVALTAKVDIPAFYPAIHGKTLFFSDLQGSLYKMILN